MGKGENAGYRKFSRAFLLRVFKVGLFCKWCKDFLQLYRNRRLMGYP